MKENLAEKEVWKTNEEILGKIDLESGSAEYV